MLTSMNRNGKSRLGVGVASDGGNLVLATRGSNSPPRVMKFPASNLGIAAIRTFLTDRADDVRLAVGGQAALRVALALTAGMPIEAFVVSSAIANQPIALAEYAGRAT